MLHVLRVAMVINSPWMLSKNWLVQKQTAFGKDMSNPFMADNLPKIVWFSTHQITCMKSWLVQKQTALGKDTSNSLIVDKLLKAIWFSIHHHLTIEVLAIPGQTATGKESPNPFMARSLPKTILYSFLHKICFHANVSAVWWLRLCCLSDAAEGFEQIIDFLSGSYINHALTVNIDVYISCIKQFWNTAVVKHSGDVTRTSWNEFSSAMASALICLSLGQRFNFSKVEGLENAKAAQQLEIVKLKARVKKLEKLNKVAAASTTIPTVKPKTLTITAAPAVSTRRRK
nr:hypothetical protein [Tanacetum cinerariifolium]